MDHPQHMVKTMHKSQQLDACQLKAKVNPPTGCPCASVVLCMLSADLSLNVINPPLVQDPPWYGSQVAQLSRASWNQTGEHWAPKDMCHLVVKHAALPATKDGLQIHGESKKLFSQLAGLQGTFAGQVEAVKAVPTDPGWAADAGPQVVPQA